MVAVQQGVMAPRVFRQGKMASPHVKAVGPPSTRREKKWRLPDKFLSKKERKKNDTPQKYNTATPRQWDTGTPRDKMTLTEQKMEGCDKIQTGHMIA